MGQIKRFSSPLTSGALLWPPDSWKHLLAKINQPRIPQIHKPSWPAGREILYVLENARRSTGTTLALQVDFREPRKNGGWKKPRPLSISHEMIEDLPDPTDREILTRLIGVQRETWYYGPYESIYRFQPGIHELETILPIVSRTDRLFFRTPEIEDLIQVSWDSAGPWEFLVNVLHDPDGQQYEVRGVFQRAGDHMEISRPDHIFPEEILVNSNLLARFRVDVGQQPVTQSQHPPRGRRKKHTLRPEPLFLQDRIRGERGCEQWTGTGERPGRDPAGRRAGAAGKTEPGPQPAREIAPRIPA